MSVDNTKFPFSSVMVPIADPLKNTFAKETGAPSSFFTTPDTLVCANRILELKAKNKKIKIVFVLKSVWYDGVIFNW